MSCKTPHNYSCLARGNRRGRKEFILSTFVNELTDMPVTVTYDPASELLRVETCYRDGKPYVFTIDVDNQVHHEVW